MRCVVLPSRSSSSPCRARRSCTSRARSRRSRCPAPAAAARVPPHRPAAEDRARGAPAGAAAGEPRADPQPRARDQEPARRHPRRGAAARARARPAAAASSTRRSSSARPTACSRWSTGCSRRTGCRPTGGPTSTRSRAGAGRRPGRVPRRRDRCATSTPACPSSRPIRSSSRRRCSTSCATPAQALAGARGEPEIRLMTRVARGVTLARRRHRLALAVPSTDNGPGMPGACATGSSFRWCRARRRQRTRAHDRADVRRPAPRHDRMRERARPHGVHDPAAARERPHLSEARKVPKHATSTSRRGDGDEAGLDRRRRPLDPLGAGEGARARGHPVQDRSPRATRSLQALAVSAAAGAGHRHPHARRIGAGAAAARSRSASADAGHHHDRVLGSRQRGRRVPGRRVRIPAQAVRRRPRAGAHPARDDETPRAARRQRRDRRRDARDSRAGAGDAGSVPRDRAPVAVAAPRC